MRDQALILGDEQGVALRADLDAVDHPPELLERDFPDHPPRFPLRLDEADRDRRRREEVVIERQGRDVRAVGRYARGVRHRQLRRARTAARDGAARRGEERDLAELRKVQDVVLQDPGLLPGLESRRAQLEAHRSEDPAAVIDVLIDLHRDLFRDAPVALDDGLHGAFLKVEDRDDAVQHQRRHGRRGDQQHETGGDPSHFAASSGRHCQRLAMTSRPGSSGTTNRVLTARATFGHARKMAGGSS